ncbi:MAG: hypothetical protein IKU65_00385 [Oscillospiraceae bacterium]|nr:hypothetical protein [Oscillospiraceae bacterium]
MYIDFHAHILPNADHGSDGIPNSLAQLENAARAGISTIVATPHYYARERSVEEFLEKREAAYNELMSNYNGDIKIIKAAEVQISLGIEKLPELPKLCIEGTNYILLEFPNEPWPYWIYDAVTEIARERRLRPICAHIDRYSHIGRDKILNLNMDVQINASAFLDTRRRRNYYLELIGDDAVHLLGSDVHGDGNLSYKDFAYAVKKIGGPLMAEMTNNAKKILAKSENK